MKEQTVNFSYKARYYTLGTKDNVRKIWFVLHGYGQLARFFLNKFNIGSANDCYFIAPEGLSRFYLKDVTHRAHTHHDRVGATWMTRENRLTDIQNYIAYLNQVYKNEVSADFNGQITILGFSQGAATATRWAIEGAITFHRLILWAGVFPPDMDVEKGHEILKSKKVIEVFGKHDPFLTDERLKEENQLSNRLNIRPERIEFDGGHEIQKEVLLNLMN